MIELEYTSGSPFARAVRVILNELRLDYVGREPQSAPTPKQLGADTPTMQVPTLRDSNVVLWESDIIAEYLLRRYSSRFGGAPRLTAELWRPTHEWEDKLLFGTVQTFGTSVTTISQMTWTGVTVRDNPHLKRCAERASLILNWLEGRLPDDKHGFLPDTLSAQDIFLACHIRFVQARPLGLDLDLGRLPKCNALLERLDERSSFITNPIQWWDPDVIGYSADGAPFYKGDR